MDFFIQIAIKIFPYISILVLLYLFFEKTIYHMLIALVIICLLGVGFVYFYPLNKTSDKIISQEIQNNNKNINFDNVQLPDDPDNTK